QLDWKQLVSVCQAIRQLVHCLWLPIDQLQLQVPIYQGNQVQLMQHMSKKIWTEKLQRYKMAVLRMSEESTVIDCTGEYPVIDRKSTRLNSSHVSMSYAVFCLRKNSDNS